MNEVLAAQRKLNELRGAGGRSFKTVTVRLDAATTGKMDLALRYTVPGASWTPEPQQTFAAVGADGITDEPGSGRASW